MTCDDIGFVLLAIGVAGLLGRALFLLGWR